MWPALQRVVRDGGAQLTQKGLTPIAVVVTQEAQGNERVMTMAEAKRFYVGQNSETGWPVRDRQPFNGAINRAVAHFPTKRLAQESADVRNRKHHGPKPIVTVGDLAEALQEIGGLPLSVRYMGGEWVAMIEWSYPDYSTDSAVGRGPSMLHAVSACLAAYEPHKQSAS